MQSQILPSREALAKRIALQFSYGQNLIHLVAGSGFGKSYLLEHFITDHYDNFNKAYVHAKASSQDADIQTYLLEHSFSYPLVDVSLSLRENFLRLIKEQGPREILWVIDNAKQLSEELLAELEWLAQHAPCTLFVLCASSQSGLLSSAIDIHLEPLPYAESLRLLSYFYTNLPHREDPIFAEFLNECKGNPALLLQWQQREQQMPKVERKANKTKWLVAGGLLVALLAIGGVYQYQQPSASGLLEELSQNPQLVEIKAIDDDEKQNDEASLSNNTVIAEALSSQHIETPVEPLLNPEPQVEESGALSNGMQATTLIETKGSINLQPEQSADISQNQIAESASAEVLSEGSQIQTVEYSSAPKATDLVADDLMVFDHAWYLAQNDEQWLWQLTIMSKEQQIEDFINRFNLADNTKHYFRADKGWHVLTWSVVGERESIQQLRTEMEEKVPGIEPYAKQIKQIKAEINSQPVAQMR